MVSKIVPGFVVVFACVTVFAAVADAQRRGGGPPGGPGGPGRGGRGAAAGAIERITIRGKALEGNRQGDSADREVVVYLPPDYAGDQARRFPVVYLLHGSGERENAFIEVLARLQESADRLAGAQGFSEFIVVTPNASTSQKASLYAASPDAGDWERFVADDLVAAIDSRYRTLTNRMSRAIAGHAEGGFAALRIGMKRPEVFASLYAMSACCLAPGEQVAATVEKYAANLKAYYAIAIDVGNADPAVELNRQFHAALTRLRVAHAYEEYDGDRSNRLRERMDRNVLTFFARNLASPANLTSPSPAADQLANQGR
jgi:enterochelin esterase-like enzyme